MIGRFKGVARRVGQVWYGLNEDLRALPARLTEPGRLTEPLNVVHHVGGGDFRAVGELLLATLVAHGLGQAGRWGAGHRLRHRAGSPLPSRAIWGRKEATSASTWPGGPSSAAA